MLTPRITPVRRLDAASASHALAALAVFVMSSLNAGCWPGESPTNAGKPTFDPEALDLGEVKKGTRLETAVTFTNRSGALLAVVKIDSSCGV